MGTSAADPRITRSAPPVEVREEESLRGAGAAWFVAILLLIVGCLNIFYGIAAVANSSFYAAGERYVFGSLHTWGWITIIVAVIQLTAAGSLIAGRMYGRVIGIIAATFGAIEALANVGGDHPWWSLGVFAVCMWAIYGLFVLGKPEEA